MMTASDPVAAAAPASQPMTIFIIHPSELITDHRPHGDGTVAWGFIRELGLRGHRVHVACEEADISASIPPTVVIHRIHTRAASGAAHTLEYMLRCRLLFERLNRVHRFDLAQQLNPVFSGLSLALAGSRVPIVLGSYVAAWPCDWDGAPADESPLRHPVKRLVAYLQQRLAAMVLVTTRAAIETRVVDDADIRAKVRFQQHGFDAATYAAPADARDLALRSKRVLFLANINGRKGIFVLIDAFALVRAAEPDATLIVAGGGTRLDEVRARVADAGLSDCVDVLGSVQRSDVISLLRSAAVYCLPSYGEPYGMTVIEAMASGLPLVLTNTGGMAEVADDAGAAYVAPGDAAVLAAAIVGVLRDPQRAREMGDHNVVRARERFDWKMAVNTLEDAYTDVRRNAASGNSSK